MSFTRLRYVFVFAVSIALLLTSCSMQPSQNPDEEFMASPSPPAAVTATAAVTPETWHYVALGDATTSTGGEGLIVYYKEMLEEDLGVAVELHNWTFRHGGTGKLLTMLQMDQQMREDLQNADIVTLQVPMDGLESALRSFDQVPESCDEACLAQAFAEYKADAEQVFDALLTLVDPTETVVRAHDTYLFNVTYLKEKGTLDIYNRYWLDAQEHIHTLGEAHQIPVAQVYRLFMGPSGNDDPAEKGWMLGITNPSEEGARVMAQLMRELGYAYASLKQ